MRRARLGITVDLSMHPLVIFTFGGVVADDDWRDMFSAYDELYRRRAPFHVVNDGMSVTSGVGPSQRRLIGEAARSREEMTRRWCLGSAVVAANTFSRGVLTAIHWFAPPVYKLTIHATFREAIDESLATLRDHAIEIPAEALAYRKLLDARDKAVP